VNELAGRSSIGRAVAPAHVPGVPRPVWIALAVCGALVLFGMAVRVVTLVNGWLVEGDDFLPYWNGASSVAAGRSPYEWLTTGLPQDWPDYIYPPLLALLLAPVTRVVDYPTARWGWLVFSTLCVVVAFLLAWRTSGLRLHGRGALAPIALVGLLPSVAIALELGQLSPQLLLVIAAGYAAIGARRSGLAGGIIAVGTYLKTFPGLLGVYLLLRRQWRAFLVAAGTGLALVLVSLLVLGWEPHWAYLTGVVPAQSRWFGGPFNVSLTGFLTRLWIDTQFTVPVADLPVLGKAAIALATVGLLAATGYAVWRAPTNRWGEHAAYGLTVVAMMLAAPINGQYNLILALVPLCVLVAWVQDGWLRGLRWLLLITLLLSLPVEYCDFGALVAGCSDAATDIAVKELPWRQGWGNLLSSGRFFGLVGLWILLLRLCLQPGRQAVPDSDPRLAASLAR
jgi:hypothetical protein